MIELIVSAQTKNVVCFLFSLRQKVSCLLLLRARRIFFLFMVGIFLRVDSLGTTRSAFPRILPSWIHSKIHPSNLFPVVVTT